MSEDIDFDLEKVNPILERLFNNIAFLFETPKKINLNKLLKQNKLDAIRQAGKFRVITQDFHEELLTLDEFAAVMICAHKTIERLRATTKVRLEKGLEDDFEMHLKLEYPKELTDGNDLLKCLDSARYIVVPPAADLKYFPKKE